MRKRQITEQYFEENTVRIAESGCQIWMGCLSKGGYGGLKNGLRKQRAHRVMWELRHGPLKDGAVVCHRCDVPSCVNPDHLFMGTYADNNADTWRKGRGRYAVMRGSQNAHSKLTEDGVILIRNMALALPTQQIADQFGINAETVRRIVRGQSWRHVPMPDMPPRSSGLSQPGMQNPSAKLTDSDVRRIRDLSQSGQSQSHLAEEFGVSQSTIFKVVRNKTWSFL